MDQSVPSTQNDQPVNRAQPPVTISRPAIASDTQQSSVPAPVSSGNKEAAPARINNEPVPTPETVDVQASENEPVIEAQVEQIVEKSPMQEKPVLPEAVKQAGVTHSGPGIIPDTTITIANNAFPVTPPPIPYAQVVAEEKKTPFKSSRHWLLGLYELVWRKINPLIGRDK